MYRTKDLPSPQNGPGTIDGYYVILFRGSSYCPTCDVMERLTSELLTSSDSPFPQDGRTKKIFFKVINFEIPGNEHYILDYDLYTTTVVLIEQKNGAAKRWKNLQDSWKLSEEKTRYERYLTDEIQKFLKEG